MLRTELILENPGSGAARPQAQAELIILGAELPPDPKLQLRVAGLFLRAQDYEHALSEYQKGLQIDRHNAEALAGAGFAAFKLGRYRTAQRYLQSDIGANPNDAQTAQLLQIASLILQSDPFARGVSSSDRIRRINAAFTQAGERLDSCARTKDIDITTSSSALGSLKAQWLATKPQLKQLNSDSAIGDATMDLVFQIEETTEKECASPNGLDQALLLLAENRSGVDQ